MIDFKKVSVLAASEDTTVRACTKYSVRHPEKLVTHHLSVRLLHVSILTL